MFRPQHVPNGRRGRLRTDRSRPRRNLLSGTRLHFEALECRRLLTTASLDSGIVIDPTGGKFLDMAANAVGQFVVAEASTDVRFFDAAGHQVGSTYHINASDQPQVAIDNSGNSVVVWQGPSDGDGLDIFAQRFDTSANAVGEVIQVNSATSADQKLPDVGMDGAGNFVVAWSNQKSVGGTGYSLEARRFNSAGAPLGAQFTVVSLARSNAAVAMNAAGEFVIACGGVVQRFNTDGTTRGDLAPTFVIGVNGSAARTRAGIDAAGNFVVTEAFNTGALLTCF